LGATTHTKKTWQRHLEKKLGLKPVMDNGFGGKEYKIEKKRIRPPRAPVRYVAPRCEDKNFLRATA
jgi:hypothetical protein